MVNKEWHTNGGTSFENALPLPKHTSNPTVPTLFPVIKATCEKSVKIKVIIKVITVFSDHLLRVEVGESALCFAGP